MKKELCLVLLFAITVLVFSNSLFAQSANADPEVTASAPDFTLPDLYGEEVSSESLKGNFLVIHIATTWCPYCNAEAPYLEKIAKEYRKRNVKVLIIDVREPAELVKAKLQDRFNFTFPVLLDVDGSVAASFAPKDTNPALAKDEIMIASNILVDPQGRIQFLSLLDSAHFDEELTDLIARLDALLAVN